MTRLAARRARNERNNQLFAAGSRKGHVGLHLSNVTSRLTADLELGTRSSSMMI
jgi:hypothetical protein